MRLLVAIASHGTRNDAHLRRLLDEYAAMPYEVNIVVLSNIEKNVGPRARLVVGLPEKNPWSLPFAHKEIFAQEVENHDLFIYCEDDTLLTQAHIEAFMWATSVLHPNEIAGFLRSEEGPDGAIYYSTIHDHYHWDTASVCRRQNDTFAHFTNDHGACYVLTPDQLRRAIASGGFRVPPHEGKYDMLVSAATDPYTQCGFKKLICVSRLEQFTCKHLTNRYVGRTGVPASIVKQQAGTLLELAHAGDGRPSAMRVEPSLPGSRWIKSYYEPCRHDLLARIPAATKRVLSIGCGWGSTEEALLRRGLDVTAIPLDVVIGRVAAARGVRVIDVDVESMASRLAGESFDVVLISGLIHLMKDPVALLSSSRRMLGPEGWLIASFPNLNHAAVWWRRFVKAPAVAGLGEFERSGVHITSLRQVTRWLQVAGFEVERSDSVFSRRWDRYHRATLGMMGGLWASDHTVVARSRAGDTAWASQRRDAPRAMAAANPSE